MSGLDPSAPTGGGDLQADVVTVNGSSRSDRINVSASGSHILAGVQIISSITGGELIDRL